MATEVLSRRCAAEEVLDLLTVRWEQSYSGTCMDSKGQSCSQGSSTQVGQANVLPCLDGNLFSIPGLSCQSALSVGGTTSSAMSLSPEMMLSTKSQQVSASALKIESPPTFSIGFEWGRCGRSTSPMARPRSEDEKSGQCCLGRQTKTTSLLSSKSSASINSSPEHVSPFPCLSLWCGGSASRSSENQGLAPEMKLGEGQDEERDVPSSPQTSLTGTERGVNEVLQSHEAFLERAPVPDVSPCTGQPSDVELKVTDDLLSTIFVCLALADLARAAQVSHRWRTVALCPDLHLESFRKKWGFERVVGVPSRFSFWQLEAPLFVLSHRIRPSDSITSLAVQYGCQTLSLRRANNMMSDHAIHTRSRLLLPLSTEVLIQLEQSQRELANGEHAPEQQEDRTGGGQDAPLPGQRETALSEAPSRSSHGVPGPGAPARDASRQGHPGEAEPALPEGGQGEHMLSLGGAESAKPNLAEWLKGKFCSVEFDSFAKRDVAVVYHGAHEVAAADEEASAEDASSEESLQQNAAKRAEARARVVKMLMRAFAVDGATAAYYLEEAGGDVRAASQELRNDMQWERSNRRRAWR